LFKVILVSSAAERHSGVFYEAILFNIIAFISTYYKLVFIIIKSNNSCLLHKFCYGRNLFA